MVKNVLFILAVSVLSSVFGEILSWMLVYRTEGYKNANEKIEMLTRQIEKMKEKEKAGKNKKLEMCEKHLQDKNQELAMMKMKSSLLLAVVLFFVYRYLSSSFDGIVVAKLPFVPPHLIRGLSHRNLEGEDFTDCAMAFVYLLCSLGLRPNIQKMFGFSPRTNMWANIANQDSGKKYL